MERPRCECGEFVSVLLRDIDPESGTHGDLKSTCVECAIPALRVSTLRGYILTAVAEPQPDWSSMVESDPPDALEDAVTEQ